MTGRAGWALNHLIGNAYTVYTIPTKATNTAVHVPDKAQSLLTAQKITAATMVPTPKATGVQALIQ